MAQPTVTPARAVRIRKTAARKLYAADRPIVIVACKLWPFGGWQPGYHAHRPDIIDRHGDDYSFDNLTRDYQSYNSSYEEGYYPAFYANLADVKALGLSPMEEND